MLTCRLGIWKEYRPRQEFVKVVWQCQQCHRAVTLTCITCLDLQFNMHDFHRGQSLKGKVHSLCSSAVVLLYSIYTQHTPHPRKISILH